VIAPNVDFKVVSRIDYAHCLPGQMNEEAGPGPNRAMLGLVKTHARADDEGVLDNQIRTCTAQKRAEKESSQNCLIDQI
jgi:hypothetical protein